MGRISRRSYILRVCHLLFHVYLIHRTALRYPRCVCLQQPGLASVFSCIVQQTREDVEFYTSPFPQFTGKTYAQVRQASKRPWWWGISQSRTRHSG